jgi:Ca-activated chloride channel family protein
MNMLWPGSLLLLGLIPLIIAIYIWMLRRRRRFAVRYSSLALVREVVQHQSRLRRYLPLALFLLALASLIIALGRPVASVRVPTGQVTIILTIDVSRSMRANDIPPSRLEAAKEAALSFVRSQRPDVQIGIVVFAGFAELIQPPTTDQEALEAAIESLTTARRTAIGSGILKSLDAIAEVDQNVVPVTGSAAVGIQPVQPGTYMPDIVVLLTDGRSNSGPLPLDAAQQAVDRGIRIYTIGFGTVNGSAPSGNQQFQGIDPFGSGNQFGGGDQFGGGFRMGFDEGTLKQIAEMTGGAYHPATSADELQKVFQNLPTYLITKQESIEISVAFTALGALVATIAIGLSLLWHPLP